MRKHAPILVMAIVAIGAIFVPNATCQQLKPARAIVSRVVPSYPDLARNLRLEGTVKVIASVAPNGTVKAVQGAGGHPLLLKAAQDAIYKWKFAPAPQETQELIELRFHPD